MKKSISSYIEMLRTVLAIFISLLIVFAKGAVNRIAILCSWSNDELEAFRKCN